MSLSTKEYFIRETYKSIKRNGLMSLASVSTVALSLLVLGMFLLIFINTNNLAQYLESQVQITVYMEDSVEAVIKNIEKIEGKVPKIITTSAKKFPNTVSYRELGKEIIEDEAPYLILFGTGWGLTDEIMDISYSILEPVRGKTEYNHLSVRSAVSIILDRLLGEN